MNLPDFQAACLELRKAYENGLLGRQDMPEDVHPGFKDLEDKLCYFTLPMSLNYQGNSYTLWESANSTFNDAETSRVFSVSNSAQMTEDELRSHLTKHKLALQPNKHIKTWQTISQTIYEKWGSIEKLLDDCDHDFLGLQRKVQIENKKGFPYLSGPKIFNYWSYILIEYCGVELKNRQYIEIAPDTHVLKCSVRLGLITDQESIKLSREEIASKWRNALENTNLTPSDMHSPLWFWSRNDFRYKLVNK